MNPSDASAPTIFQEQTDPEINFLTIQDFGLYVHWPFCRSKCPYCDFNSHVRPTVDHTRWKLALLKELHTFSTRMTGYRLVSIFFGGGTPSLMNPDTVGDIISSAQEIFQPPFPLEITLEANPTHIEASLFEAFSQAGVNRLSMGIQSLRDEGLTLLGRTYTARQAHEAIAKAKTCFAAVSLDLIYLYQDHTYTTWQEELDEIIPYAPQHLSAYQLMYSPGTLFHRKRTLGRMKDPNSEESHRFQTWTHQRLALAGFTRYEISNYAQPLCESRHNRLYWQSLPFLGVGPGAHGRYWHQGNKLAYKTWSLPERWLKAVEDNGHGEEECEILKETERFVEWLIMGLRLMQGVDIKRCLDETGFPFEAWLPQAPQDNLTQQGLWHITEHYLRLTPRGLEVLDEILRYISQNLTTPPNTSKQPTS